MSVETITTISPITNKPVLTRSGPSDADLQAIPENAKLAFESYRRTSLADRQKIVKKALKLLNDRQDELAKEITEQMGRPIAYTPKEITTAVMRGEYLLKISEETLKDTEGEPEKGFKRYIRKVPIGPVLILFPWNVCAQIHQHIHHYHILICPTVSIPDSYEFDSSRSTHRKLSHLEAFAPDANKCRADSAHLQRRRTPQGCHSSISLRIP
jgi:hypothetical protein